MPNAIFSKNMGLFPNQAVISAFSRRIDGNMSLNYGDTHSSLENRKEFLNGVGINYQDLVCAKQPHSGNARYVNEPDKSSGAFLYETAIDNADALITDRKRIPISVFTADCLSVFLYDTATPAVGIAHAGWRGTKEKIVIKSIKLMQDKFNTKLKNVYAVFGPCVRPCCYEVEGYFKDFFADWVIERDNRHYLDLPLVNKAQLLDSGLNEKNISDPGFCTYCQNQDFFSFRKEKDAAGRMISVIMLL